MVTDDPMLQYQRMHDNKLTIYFAWPSTATMLSGPTRTALQLEITNLCVCYQLPTSRLLPRYTRCSRLWHCFGGATVLISWYTGLAAGWPGVCLVSAAVATCCTMLLNTFNALFNAWMFSPVDPGPVAILIYITKKNVAKNSVVEEIIQYASYTGSKFHYAYTQHALHACAVFIFVGVFINNMCININILRYLLTAMHLSMWCPTIPVTGHVGQYRGFNRLINQMPLPGASSLCQLSHPSPLQNKGLNRGFDLYHRNNTFSSVSH